MPCFMKLQYGVYKSWESSHQYHCFSEILSIPFPRSAIPNRFFFSVSSHLVFMKESHIQRSLLKLPYSPQGKITVLGSLSPSLGREGRKGKEREEKKRKGKKTYI